MYRSIGSLDKFLATTVVPPGLVDVVTLPEFLKNVHVLDYAVRTNGADFESTVTLGIERELSAGFAPVAGAKFFFGNAAAPVTFFRATVAVERGDFSITLHDLEWTLRFGSDKVGGSGKPSELSFRGTVRLDSALSLTATDLVLTGDLEGVLEPGEAILVGGLHLSPDSLALRWREPNINRWLRKLSSDLADTAPAFESDVTLRVVFGDPIREIRLDWQVLGLGRTLTLPGLSVTTPDNAQLSLLFGGEGRPLTRVALGLTFVEGTALTASSNFAWERGDDREIHGDDSRPDQPLIRVTFTAQRAVSLAILDFDFTQAKLPKFLRQIEPALVPLDFADPDSLDQPSGAALEPLDAGDWEIDFDFNLESAPFKLPFLKAPVGGEAQHLQIEPLDLARVQVRFADQTISLPLGITVFIDRMRLHTEVGLTFNWEQVAFRVDHERGLELTSKEPVIAPADEFLGLSWRFIGKHDPTTGLYHYLTLATKDHNYQLQQPPGSRFELEYSQLSADAIVFALSDLVISDKGVSLAATVTDKPAKLNGVDTRFRFSDSQLIIKENRITGFTLSGSGPLPPALVGDATADIALQMEERDRRLRLVSGAARLKGSKLLDCKGTRFQFTIDAIGLRFVDEGGFHLYFTLTGSAQFKLAEGDDRQGALALLPSIKIDLVECPLTGDARVIAKHVSFLVELPRPLSFNFLGAFEMELRGIGFVPQAAVFDDEPAMIVTGQLKFAQGGGDTADPRSDYHKLYVGLPKPGTLFPRIHFANLPVLLALGSAFQLNGVVDFVDSATEKGFSGEGSLTIQGLPTLAASFAFLRVRRSPDAPWVRAWFLYVEARKVSFQVPVVTLYIREVGLGFGYRFTLAAIKKADESKDVRQLIQELKVLSRTQGELSKRDRWALDVGDSDEEPRWTVALRALISQTSAATSPLRYDEGAERELPCLFLFDAVIALRSDLTFFMAVRGWLFANYFDYVSDHNGLRSRPVVSGFVLLSPRQKRFLAHVASNPDGQLGAHPPVPAFMLRALSKSQFSATLLVEPGLFHMELGWPNQLRWGDKLGPLEAEFRGGFIFRVSGEELVTGTSFFARASLSIRAGVDFGFVGVSVSATARVAFGARYIGLLSLRDPLRASALYGGIGIEAMVEFALEFWIRIKVWRFKIQKTWRFSFQLEFTAGLEFGLVGITNAGLRGTGHLAVSVMGRRFALGAHLGVREGAVREAYERTRHVLSQGLEATEVEAIPGTTGTGSATRAAPAPELRSARALARDVESPVAASVVEPTAAEFSVPVPSLQVPSYSVFVVRAAQPDAFSYFVLLPAGERETGSGFEEEAGFLPVPPDPTGPSDDFVLTVPKTLLESYTLEQFEPQSLRWTPRVLPAEAGPEPFGWKANWDAELEDLEKELEDGDVVHEGAEPDPGDPADAKLTLRAYLRNAFVAQGDPAILVDPAPLPDQEAVEDARVHNPTDSAFEAAVRGAFEQFRGSPFFRRPYRHASDGRDEIGNEYERLLDRAYDRDTTIYTHDGEVPTDDAKLRRMRLEQQAHEMRGLMVHDMVADLREIAAGTLDTNQPGDAKFKKSIALHLGLVFRVRGTLPAWLEGPAAGPQLAQRLGPSGVPQEPGVKVRTFNIKLTDFAHNQLRFERVQQLTDASTIALAWDLAWSKDPGPDLTPAQRDPEHHLMHYAVRRRALDGEEREVVYTVKGADTLHREQGPGAGILKRLRRRFQLVDNFTEETAEDLAALPPDGKSYLYSITPIDFSGNAGRPLSLVATRYPNEPPQVPLDASCVVHYVVDAPLLRPAAASAPTTPLLVTPAALTVEWSEPAAPQQGPVVPVDQRLLVFRRESALPIGSYGLDSSTQRPAVSSLPTSNARPLPTDIKVLLTLSGPPSSRRATVSLTTLKDCGVLPDDGQWRPESWRVFFQTVAKNRVPSALAPVSITLRVAATFDPQALLPPERREERRTAELEWLPRPMAFEFLPSEDELAQVGPVHRPMPRAGAARFGDLFDAHDQLEMMAYAPHPEGQRCVRFRWNQGPSAAADYPLGLTAGYRLVELDIDAHTTATFAHPDKLRAALRPIQEVQMIPAAELVLTPGDTLAHAQWEAWYPSTVERIDPRRRASAAEVVYGPWYSWRESELVWPAWAGLTDGAGTRDQAHHPALRAIVEKLAAPSAPGGRSAYFVELQASPTAQPGDFAAFLRTTAASADPYGWGVLQRLGLCVALRLRRTANGEIVSGKEQLEALKRAIAAAALGVEASRHLYVELLFQPGRSVALDENGAVPADSLLALVQLSLRPTLQQTRRYHCVQLRGTPGGAVDFVVKLPAGTAVSVVDQADSASGQAELSAPDAPATIWRTVRLPIGGQTGLLLRIDAPQGSEPIAVGVGLRERLADPAAFRAAFGAWFDYHADPQRHLVLKAPFGEATPEQVSALAALLAPADRGLAALLLALSNQSFTALDVRSTYFSTELDTLATSFAAAGANGPWGRFVRYAQALSSTDPDVPDSDRIHPPTSKEDIAKVLPDFVAWAQRFFDHSGAASPDETYCPTGPWLATAYPRSGSPVHACPDQSARLTYDHLVVDPWAHTYRYYIRPYGRYDMLWQSLRRSPALFPDEGVLAERGPDPSASGLDVVLERTRAVAKPLVLSSRRLDAPSTPASPAPPGATWEVIVAEHPEQALVMHNQTLARQLAFRQIAYALLRKFAFPAWVTQLGSGALPSQNIELDLVEDDYPPIPHSYPAEPEHVDLTQLSETEARRLDLPVRIPSFQQGALVLSWDALPFFYEHQLLLVAQSASTVSPLNVIEQRDFEYVTPLPEASMVAVLGTWTPAPPFGSAANAIEVRSRRVRIPLRQLWESLPLSAQSQWPSEAPDGVKRKPAWLPDLGVVYQLVELFTGNVEVQAELYFDERAGRWARRQLGARLLVDIGELRAPEGAGRFELAVVVQQITQQALSRAYTAQDRERIASATRAKVAFSGQQLSFVGVMTHADRDALLGALDAADSSVIGQIHDGWYSHGVVSEEPSALPPELAHVLEVPDPLDARLVWEGSLSPAENAALLALSGDEEFVDAVKRLVVAIGSAEGSASVTTTPGPEIVPRLLRGRVALPESGGSYSDLAWTGNMTDRDAAELSCWARVRVLAEAVARLTAVADGCEHTAEVSAPRPLQGELPLELAGRFEVGDTHLAWTGLRPTPDERALLLALEGDVDFVDAKQRLLAAIEAPSVPLPAVVMRPATLPLLLDGRLLIAADGLSWPLPFPTNEQRVAMLALTGDRAFLAAVRALLAAIDAGSGVEVAMAPFIARPSQADLPPLLRSRLLVAEASLHWSAPAPNAEERAALDTLVADDAMNDALAALRAQLDADVHRVTMTQIVRRPRQRDLPEFLDGQLVLTPKRITWRGRLHDESLRQFLLDLAGDAPFRAAVVTLLAAVDAQRLSVPFRAPVRPAAGALGILSDKLLIGRATLRYHGLMTVEERLRIAALFSRAVDLRAVSRLFAATQRSGMRGREIKLRARRGSAAPSSLRDIAADRAEARTVR